MRKLFMATFVAIISVFASITAAKASPIAPMTLPYSIAGNAINQSVLPVERVHRRRYRHRRHVPGFYVPYYGYGYGYRPYRSCRRVRRSCRARFGRGRDYRRCMRRRGC